MRNKLILAILFAMLGLAALGGCATAPAQPEGEWDGLVRQSHPRLNAVFIRPGAAEDMGAFRNVILDPVHVSFASDFETGRRSGSVARRLNANDLAEIRASLADQFLQIFRDELLAGGYTLVEEPGADTLRVSAAIIDLFISAPEAAQPIGRSRIYTTDSGRMTLVLELSDSVTGEILARAVDTQSGRSDGMWTVTDRVTNTAESRRALRKWAQALRQGLDELYANSM